ncbi:hypothetical protein Tco_0662133 [Tanacetum coccineum]
MILMESGSYNICRAVQQYLQREGQAIFMLVEKDYPLTKGLATLMLCNKLRVDQQPELSTARPKLSTANTKIESIKLEATVEEKGSLSVGFITTQQMVISSPCLTDIKNWLVQSKRLLLASPKQTALALAIPEQTATGKEISNPFMAGSLPKTTWPT